MSNKRSTIILSILIVGMIAIVFAATYSYFSGKINNKDGDVSVNSGEIKLSILNDTITATSLEPIYDTDINTSSKIYNSNVTVSRDTSTIGDICYDLKLVIDQIGTSLANMSEDIKYQVYDGNLTIDGNLSSTSEKLLYSNQQLTANNSNKTYTIKVWLSYNDEIDQTEMLKSSTISDRQLKMHLVADGTSGNCN